MIETYSIVLKLKEYRGIIYCIVLIHFSTFKYQCLELSTTLNTSQE